eukprot:tig00000492_g1442.t1
MHPDDFRRLRAQTELPAGAPEIGGILEPQCPPQIDQVGWMVPQNVTKGSSSSVEVPHGPIEFHVHHGNCDQKERCWFQQPSSADMFNIGLDSVNGNYAHLVFAPEGTYVVSARNKLRQQLEKGGPQEAQRLMTAIRDELEARVKRFLEDPSTTYHSFRDSWFQAVGRWFVVHMTEPDRPPFVDLPWE